MEEDTLREIYFAVQEGRKVPKGFNKEKLSTQDGCLLKGFCVVIPKNLRKQILQEIHMAHTGIVKMKPLARGHLELVYLVAKPVIILLRQRSTHRPTQVPHDREYISTIPDHFTAHILAQSCSTKAITSTSTINILQEIFSKFGLPFTLVSDNGKNFKLLKFDEFLKSNGINHNVTAPHQLDG
ncbi:hypothetical protein HUJ04_011189 [Dendroctonus ponderosae]|nr:hypothetical protein HUJ04_011189 [Dendroctonus ponderosae]